MFGAWRFLNDAWPVLAIHVNILRDVVRLAKLNFHLISCILTMYIDKAAIMVPDDV